MADPRITENRLDLPQVVPAANSNAAGNQNMVVLTSALRSMQIFAQDTVRQNRELSTSVNRLEIKKAEQDAVIKEGVRQVNALSRRVEVAERSSEQDKETIRLLQERVNGLTQQRDAFQLDLVNEREQMNNRIHALNTDSNAKLGELAQLMTEAVNNSGSTLLPQERKNVIREKFGEILGNQIIESMDQASIRASEAKLAREAATLRQNEQIQDLHRQLDVTREQVAAEKAQRSRALKAEADRQLDALSVVLRCLKVLLAEITYQEEVIFQLSNCHAGSDYTYPSMAHSLQNWINKYSWLSKKMSFPSSQLQEIIRLKNQYKDLLVQEITRLTAHKNSVIQSKNDLDNASDHYTACRNFEALVNSTQEITRHAQDLQSREKARLLRWKIHLQGYEPSLEIIESYDDWFEENEFSSESRLMVKAILHNMRSIISEETNRIDNRLTKFNKPIPLPYWYSYKYEQWKWHPKLQYRWLRKEVQTPPSNALNLPVYYKNWESLPLSLDLKLGILDNYRFNNTFRRNFYG